MKQVGFKNEINLCDTTLQLIDKSLLRYEGEVIKPTSLGKACALTGLKVDTVVRISGITIENENRSCLETWINELTYSQEVAEIKMPVFFHYQFKYNYGDYRPDEDTKQPLTITEAKALYFSKIIPEWIEGLELYALEEKYKISAGMIFDIARRFAWLFFSAGEVMKSLGQESSAENLMKIGDFYAKGYRKDQRKD